MCGSVFYDAQIIMLEILFQYGPVTLRTFNLFVAIAFFLGGVFLLRCVTRQKMSVSFLAHYFLYFILAALIGGRMGYVFENLSLFMQDPLSSLYVWDLEFSFFGAFLALFLALYFVSRSAREDFWAWSDAFILSNLLALIFIHIGQFFDGMNYGRPTDLPWGITLDTQNIPFISPIHPTQLYSALATLIIFLYAKRYMKHTHLSGMAGSLALMLYALAMLGIDFFHGAPSLYAKISYGIVAMLAFVSLVHCSYKTHSLPH